MQHQDIPSLQTFFASRLDTLKHLLSKCDTETLLEQRLAPDMHPLGTQIAFTCNQPYNFARWCQGKTNDNLNPSLKTLIGAHALIDDCQALLASIDEGIRIPSRARVDLGPSVHIDFSGAEYINDFLIPNFYFHLVTAYGVLRMSGMPIGKADYMWHVKDMVVVNEA